MTKWEYARVDVGGISTEEKQATLNEYGDRGFRAVEMNHQHGVYFFERRKRWWRRV